MSQDNHAGHYSCVSCTGWTLGQSPALLDALVSGLAGYSGGLADVQLHFQRSEREKGRTDLEIIVPDEVHLILEAKKGGELNAVRIRKAKRLLQQGVATAAVAFEVGYADQSHLTKRFKGSVGVPPTAWRRSILDK